MRKKGMKALVFSLLMVLSGSLPTSAATHWNTLSTNISSFGAHPSWSPDSRRIAFSICECGGGGGGIWVFDRITSQTHKIHTSGDFPSWSPAGDQIAFSTTNAQLKLIRPDGNDLRDTKLIGGWGLHWSPDGQYMLTSSGNYTPADKLLLIDTKTWIQTELPFAQIGARRKVGDFAWTPEGNVLLTVPAGGAGDWAQNELREYSLSGALIRSIRLIGFERKPYQIEVAANGKFMVFGRGSRGIWIAKRDGSEANQILTVGAAPSVSPDQRWLAYDDSSSTSNTRNGIYILGLHSQLE